MRSDRKRKTRSDIGSGHKTPSNWRMLIKAAESRLEKTRVKQAQLEALLDEWRKQAANGAPSPVDVAALGTDLSKLLQ